MQQLSVGRTQQGSKPIMVNYVWTFGLELLVNRHRENLRHLDKVWFVFFSILASPKHFLKSRAFVHVQRGAI